MRTRLPGDTVAAGLREDCTLVDMHPVGISGWWWAQEEISESACDAAGNLQRVESEKEGSDTKRVVTVLGFETGLSFKGSIQYCVQGSMVWRGRRRGR